MSRCIVHLRFWAGPFENRVTRILNIASRMSRVAVLCPSVHRPVIGGQKFSAISALCCFADGTRDTSLAEPDYIDIDFADADNELACSDYVHSIMNHLFESEVS